MKSSKEKIVFNQLFRVVLKEVGEDLGGPNPAHGNYADSGRGFALADSGGQQQAEKLVVARSSCSDAALVNVSGWGSHES